MQIAVALTTAPRKECPVHLCIESLCLAGFDNIQIFAEPGSPQTHLPTITHPQRMGVWHNWLAACNWGLEQNVDYIMTVQDDALFHPDSRSFIERIDWQDNWGYLSLYTPKHYQFWKDGIRPRPRGLYEVQTNSVWGAMGLVFKPNVLKELVNHPRAKSWLGAKISRKPKESAKEHKARWENTKEFRRENPCMIQNSDTAIGIILRRLMKRKLMYINPSAINHCSAYSSIGHGGNTGKRNAYFIADPSISLYDQVFNETTTPNRQ